MIHTKQDLLMFANTIYPSKDEEVVQNIKTSIEEAKKSPSLFDYLYPKIDMSLEGKIANNGLTEKEKTKYKRVLQLVSSISRGFYKEEKNAEPKRTKNRKPRKNILRSSGKVQKVQ